MKKAIILMMVVALAAVGFYYWNVQQKDKLPEYIAQSNGRLQLKRIDVASLYGGRVAKINVDEGEEVKAGDVLAELYSTTSSSRLEEAQAAALRQKEAVVRAQAAQAQTKQSVARAQANVDAARQQQRVAKLEWDNARKLLKEQLVSAAEVAKRQADYERAVAGVRAAEAARDEAQAVVEQTGAQIAEARAGVEQAKAQVKSATSANDDMNIRSPIDGRIEYKLAEAGNVIGAGSKVVSLLDPSDVSMNIFLPTGSISRLKVGDEARIILDGIDAVFPAKIAFIATEAQFTPKSVETESERAKLMFKVKLEIPVETAIRYNRLLKGGLTGNGFVRTSHGDWPSELAVKLPQ